MNFKQVPTQVLPMKLLLEADPSEACIRTYLDGAWGYVAESEVRGLTEIVGVCVVKPTSETNAELFNIAVDPCLHQRGIGSGLLQFVLDDVEQKGIREIALGTGAFGYQLTFYQKYGFRVTGVIPDFFLDNYEDPIFENGLQHKDMLRLHKVF